jgi:Mitochondrial carrier protein
VPCVVFVVVVTAGVSLRLVDGRVIVTDVFFLGGALQFVPRDENDAMDVRWNMLAGSTAGAVSVLCTYPLDLLRVQIATDVGSRRFSGIWDAATKIVNVGGVHGLYRGIFPSMAVWMNMCPCSALLPGFWDSDSFSLFGRVFYPTRASTS